MYSGDKEIGQACTSLFQSQSRSKRQQRFKINWFRLFATKPHVDLSPLEIPFPNEEIKAATFKLGVDEALGLDIIILCNDFYTNSANLERIN